MTNSLLFELQMIKTKTLEKSLPIWVDHSLEDNKKIPLEHRFDNNYFACSYFESLNYLKQLMDNKIVEVKYFEDLIFEKFTGIGPNDDGDVPLIDGKKIRPNTVNPVYQKFATIDDSKKKFLINMGEILVTKDGMPGAFAIITESYLNTFKEVYNFDKVALSTHVYKVILKKDYEQYSSFIVAFMNSRVGQGLVRHFISGSVIPTIGSDDIDKLLIPIPLGKSKKILPSVEEQINKLQHGTNELAKTVSFSNKIINSLFDKTNVSPDLALTCNWMPGGKRDPHGYYQQ